MTWCICPSITPPPRPHLHGRHVHELLGVDDVVVLSSHLLGLGVGRGGGEEEVELALALVLLLVMTIVLVMAMVLLRLWQKPWDKWLQPLCNANIAKRDCDFESRQHHREIEQQTAR